MILKEDRQLYRGIFWITDIDDYWNSKLYFQIPCNSNGDIDDMNFQIQPTMSSTGSNNYNHERVWKTLSKKETNNNPFNYYPRGRVEIFNSIAKVFHSPYLNQEELKRWVIDKFNLNKVNGIKKIKMIADGSNHYRCYLDE